MISIVLYGRNDNYGYNLHKRAALSLNCLAHLLTADTDEIIFVDYNTPDDFPTFPEAVQDTLTTRTKRFLRVLRVRASVHARYAACTHLQALEPIARNVAIRRSDPRNRWILSTNTDMIFVPRRGKSLTEVASKAPNGFYHLPRFEIPESLWETLDRRKPAKVIRAVSRWGQSFHLNEIVYMHDVVKFDGPGDFQMMLRDDLLHMNGFDERMLVGWHVDSDIAKRLTLLRGRVSDLTADLYGYHCDHTRQVTPAHRPDGVQNDWRMFFEDVQAPVLEEQAAQWGLANDCIEEIRFERSGVFFGMPDRKESSYLGALHVAIDGPMREPSSVTYIPETYDLNGYDANHVIPFLVDALVCYPRDTCLGWFGSRRDLLAGFAKAWHAMGFSQPILVGWGSDWLAELPRGVSYATTSDIASRAGAFVFDFGLPVRTAHGGAVLPQTERALIHVARGLRAIARAERVRLASPNRAARRLIAVNGLHNRFEQLVRSRIGAVTAPMGTRLRQGFVAKSVDTWKLFAMLSPGGAGKRVSGHVDSIPDIPGYIVYGPGLDLEPGSYCFRLRFKALDFAVAALLQAAPLRLEIVSLPYIIDYCILSVADLMRGEVAVSFSVTREVSDIQAAASVQFRLKTDGRISVSLLDAVLDSVPPSTAHERAEFDWLPLMSIGDAGERCNVVDARGMPTVSGWDWRVRSTADGCIIHGPYFDLLPGRYELSIDVERENAGRDQIAERDGVVVIEVLAWARFHLAQLYVPQEDLPSGPRRIEFVIPHTVAAWKESADLQFRVRTVGGAPIMIGSVRTRQLPELPEWAGEAEWLPLMSIGPGGECFEKGDAALGGIKVDAVPRDYRAVGLSTPLSPRIGMYVRPMGEGFVLFGPYCELLAGRYQLAVEFVADAGSGGEAVPSDGVVIVDVIAQSCSCLAELSIAHGNLRPGVQRLEFVVPDELASGGDAMRLEFRIRVAGRAHFAVGSVRTRRFPDEPELSEVIGAYS